MRDALHARAAGLLADSHQRTGWLAAVTHAAVIKAMVVQTLGALVQAMGDVDVPPATLRRRPR